MKGHIVIYNDKNIFQIFTDDGEKVDEYEFKEITIENYNYISGNIRPKYIQGVKHEKNKKKRYK